MTKTEAFTLVVQRKRIDDDDNSQLDILINSDDETGVRGATFIVRLQPTRMSYQTPRWCIFITSVASRAKTE